MAGYNLELTVSGGSIKCAQSHITADSVDFVGAEFTFDSSWDTLLKTAVFRFGELVYNVPVEDDTCLIPYEAICDGTLYISVFGVNGTTRATTTEVAVNVEKSGYTIVDPSAPSQDPYSYYIESVTALKESSAQSALSAQQYSEAADDSNLSAAQNALSASQSALSAQQYSTTAQNCCSAAQGYSESAEQNATSAEQDKTAAQTYAANAEVSAQTAQQTVLSQLEQHNNSQASHAALINGINEAKSIAKGKAKGHVFDTVTGMNSWINNHIGKNLCPLPQEGKGTGYSVTVNDDGTFNYYGNASFGSYGFEVLLKPGTYTASGSDKMMIMCGDSGFKNLPYTFTLEQKETVYVYFWGTEGENDLSLTNMFVQIEKGSTATSFSAYSNPLCVGDNLYIRELNVPDYWWDGCEALELGAEKPDFSSYATKDELNGAVGTCVFKQMSYEDYETASAAGTLDAGTIYFVYGESTE